MDGTARRSFEWFSGWSTRRRWDRWAIVASLPAIVALTLVHRELLALIVLVVVTIPAATRAVLTRRRPWRWDFVRVGLCAATVVVATVVVVLVVRDDPVGDWWFGHWS